MRQSGARPARERRTAESPRRLELAAASRLARLRGDVRIPIGHEHPRDLSAGERRILAITLQTLDSPQVLLIDEPTRGLDPTARTAVAAALRAAADDGAAVLIATHDLNFAHGLGARILPMSDGVVPSTAADAARRNHPSRSPGRQSRTAAPRSSTGNRHPGSGTKSHRLRMPRAVELAVLAAANLLASVRSAGRCSPRPSRRMPPRPSPTRRWPSRRSPSSPSWCPWTARSAPHIRWRCSVSWQRWVPRCGWRAPASGAWRRSLSC